jgi:predicted ATPase
LLQDAAYQSLLKSTRRQYHQQIASVLKERFSDITETQPELLAHHYTEADLAEQAIPYWQKAGERAVQRSTWVEAVGHFTRGLELLKTLADTPTRVQQELTLQLSLNVALTATRGYTAPEVKKTMIRIQELSQQLGETPQLFPVLFRLWQFDQLRGEFQPARELAEQLMRLAQSVQDRYLLSMAHEALGWTLYFLGESTSARPHFEQAIALYDPEQHPGLTVGTGDPRVDCLSFASWALWLLGYPDQALKRSHEALALARERSRPLMLAMASGCAAVLHLFRREEQIAQELAEGTITLSTEQGAPYWLAVGTLTRGGALALQGQEKEGMPQLRQGLAALRAMGAEMSLTWLLALLAEAHEAGGQVEDGLRVLTEALDVVNKMEERFYEAELYRIKGELTLQKLSVVSSQLSVTDPRPLTPDPQAEACFLKAIEIARKQQAKSWELRATTSLARLWQQQGRTKEAHEMLAAVYNWFTEGLDTKDLQEAKELLESMRERDES